MRSQDFHSVHVEDLDLSEAGIMEMTIVVHEGTLALRLLDVGLPQRDAKVDLTVRFEGLRFFRGLRDASPPQDVVLTTFEEVGAAEVLSLEWDGTRLFTLDFGWARASQYSGPDELALSDHRGFRLSCGPYTAEWLARSYKLEV